MIDATNGGNYLLRWSMLIIFSLSVFCLQGTLSIDYYSTILKFLRTSFQFFGDTKTLLYTLLMWQQTVRARRGRGPMYRSFACVNGILRFLNCFSEDF